MIEPVADEDLATCGQTPKKQKTCKGNCWLMDTPIKSSKGRWLIRIRSCRACGRKTQSICYKSDSEIENIRKDRTKYEQFKRDIEAAANNQTPLW